MSNVLIISDSQIPFDRDESIPFLKAVAKKYKVNKVVQIGDLVDHYALSFYSHDPDAMSAGDELKATLKKLQAYYKAFPKVDVIYGNHDIRFARKAVEAGIPKAYVKELADVLQFPKGWKFHDELIIDDVVYCHGDRFGSGNGTGAFKKAVDAYMASVVFGHFHSQAGIKYFANKKHLCFAMNVGTLMDTKSYAAAYGESYAMKPIISCAVILNGQPILIPMQLTSSGKWKGAGSV